MKLGGKWVFEGLVSGNLYSGGCFVLLEKYRRKYFVGCLKFYLFSIVPEVVMNHLASKNSILCFL